MKLAAAIAFALVLTSADAYAVRADQIDCIFKWASPAAARADAAALAETLPDDQGIRQFLTDHVVAPLEVWRASQGTTDADGNVVHSPLPGFFALISADHVIHALANDPALQLCINRDKMNAGIPGYVLVNNVGSAALLRDLRFQPIFMGANMPWGSVQ